MVSDDNLDKQLLRKKYQMQKSRVPGLRGSNKDIMEVDEKGDIVGIQSGVNSVKRS